VSRLKRLFGTADALIGRAPERCVRSKDWLKFKNPAAPAVKRETEEDWGKEQWR